MPWFDYVERPFRYVFKNAEPWLSNVDKLLHEGNVFVDVGAYHCIYTFTARSIVGEGGKVVAVEPYPDSFHIILEKAKREHLRNVIIANVACGNQEGIMRLLLADKPFEHSILRKLSHRCINVKVRKLDNLLNDLGIKKVNLIKIDVEGMELDVLEVLNTCYKMKPT